MVPSALTTETEEGWMLSKTILMGLKMLWSEMLVKLVLKEISPVLRL